MSAAPRPMPRDEAAMLLGVQPDAAAADVQKAFVRAARQVHPDVLPDADEGERRAAAARFDALVRARAVLLDPPAPPETAGGRAAPSPSWSPGRRTAPGRGLGDSLVVIALLAFLIVALVTLDGALRGHAIDPNGDTSTTGTRLAP